MQSSRAILAAGAPVRHPEPTEPSGVDRPWGRTSASPPRTPRATLSPGSSRNIAPNSYPSTMSGTAHGVSAACGPMSADASWQPSPIWPPPTGPDSAPTKITKRTWISISHFESWAYSQIKTLCRARFGADKPLHNTRSSTDEGHILSKTPIGDTGIYRPKHTGSVHAI